MLYAHSDFFDAFRWHKIGSDFAKHRFPNGFPIMPQSGARQAGILHASPCSPNAETRCAPGILTPSTLTSNAFKRQTLFPPKTGKNDRSGRFLQISIPSKPSAPIFLFHFQTRPKSPKPLANTDFFPPISRLIPPPPIQPRRPN